VRVRKSQSSGLTLIGKANSRLNGDCHVLIYALVSAELWLRFIVMPVASVSIDFDIAAPAACPPRQLPPSSAPVQLAPSATAATQLAMAPWRGSAASGGA
jgi:hypothetical protein